MQQPKNESVRNYAPQDTETKSVKKALSQMAQEKIEIPLFIGGKEIRTGKTKKVVMPHDRQKVLAEFHQAGPAEMEQAVQASHQAKKEWERLDGATRAAVFLKAADLIAGEYRDVLNAATMLGQSKNIFQAEIDAACELIDFLRFNAYFYQEIQKDQPLSVPGLKNSLEYRALEGFVFAITPFNFTAIAGNLPAAPALIGNTVVWKPSDTQMLSAYYTYRIFEKAGLPAGVINMIGAEGPEAGATLLPHRDLAGVHFTGSTGTFQTIFKTIGSNISNYRSYPRIVGETGGKDFIFAHASADVDVLVTAIVRGAFEYQGQKCSAASRVYIPQNLWPSVKEKLIEQVKTIKVGDVQDFSNFMNAVIDERSYKKITGFIKEARASSDAEIIVGGNFSDEVGYLLIQQ